MRKFRGEVYVGKRIIPCLDVRDGRVVKGVNFVNIRDAGDPVELAKFYSDAGADEIVFLDITATSDGRATVADVVERTGLPGLRAPDGGGRHPHPGGFSAAARAGADKISVNSAAVEDPTLIARAAERFGSQCVVLAIDARVRPDGSLGGGDGGRTDPHRPGRGGLGPGRGGLGGGGDPPHLHGRRRHQGRV